MGPDGRSSPPLGWRRRPIKRSERITTTAAIATPFCQRRSERVAPERACVGVAKNVTRGPSSSAANVEAKASQLGKRFFGFFAKARTNTISSRRKPRSDGSTDLGGEWIPAATFAATAVASSPENARRPVRASYKVAASENWSVSELNAPAEMTSGAQ